MSSAELPSGVTVAAWLEQLGLPQYGEDFERHGITPQLLGSLTDSELREIGVEALGHRKTILLGIAALNKTAPISATPAPVLPAPAILATPKTPSVSIPPAAIPQLGAAAPAPATSVFIPPAVPASSELAVSQPSRWSWKRLGGKFLIVSILVHVLFGAAAAIWVVQEIQAKRKLTFKAGEKSPNPSTRAVEHKVQMQKKKTTMSAPAQAKRITTTGMSKVALPEMPVMATSTTLTSNQMSGAGGVGSLAGLGGAGAMGGGGAGGGGRGINFFGLRTSAKRIAFLLDYSGSMDGEFRKAMERELDKALKKLPPGTQLLLIPWAGPAWLYNETAPKIMSKWNKIDNYDNFELKAGAKRDPPTWISSSPKSVEDIMKGIQAQVAAPGGTDWRQPFRYAMEANPPPDVIIFMTDGQIPANTADRAMSAIDAAIKKASRPPVVNCLWIKNQRNEGAHLKKLASKYKGEYKEISSKSGSDD